MALILRQVLKIGALGGLGLVLVLQIKRLLLSIREAEEIAKTEIETIDDLIAGNRLGKGAITNAIVKLQPYYFQPQKYVLPIRSAERQKYQPSDSDVVRRVTRKLSRSVPAHTLPGQVPNTWFASLNHPHRGKNYIKINGFGQVQGDFFSVHRQFQKIGKLGYWTRFKQWVNSHLTSLLDRTKLVGNDRSLGSLLLGPVIGFLNYEVSLASDTRILAVCNIENGEIIPSVTACSKSELVRYFSARVQGNYVKVSLLLLSVIVVGRWLWSDIKWYLNVLKVRREKLTRSYFIPEGVVADDKMCIICYANCRNIIFFDCRHMIMCRECSESYESEVCPYCKVEIDDVKVVKGVK